MKGIDLGERFIKKIGILVSMMLVTSCSYKLKQVQPTSFTENKHLETNYPAEWKGTPLDRKGNFMNHEFPFEFRFYDVVKWKVGHNPQKSEKRNDKWMPETQTETGFLQSNEDMIVWLGHATFFVRINGIELITDPAFFDLPFAHRHASIPVDPSAFKKLNYILVSHNHRDHCDKKSLQLLAKSNPHAEILSSLKLDELIQKWTPNVKTQASGWYQKYKTDNRKIEIFYVPSRHWSKRGPFDVNTMLWGGFIIKAKGQTIYFMGDSGYGSHFNQIGKLFPKIDYAMMGIGAYSPRWFMSPNHINIDEAIKAFDDLGARKFIPMHYGTFDQADEPLSEPLKLIKAESKLVNKLIVPKLGEVILLCNNRD